MHPSLLGMPALQVDLLKGILQIEGYCTCLEEGFGIATYICPPIAD